MMAERFRLPPVITGSTWNNVFGFLWQKPPRGTAPDRDGVIAPVFTNREALALVQALRTISPTISAGFPLWYQFAAVAYGWDTERDVLDLSKEQADRMYDPNAAVALMLEVQRITGDLDDERGGQLDPRLELDQDDFDDRLVQGDVQKALQDDGAEATAIIPRCKDRKTGKTRFPRAKCDANGKGPTIRDPATGAIIELPCDKDGDCDAINPIAKVRKLEKLLLIGMIAAGAIYLFAPAALSGVIAGRVARNPRRGRRTRRR
jgi:hypothetical protein